MIMTNPTILASRKLRPSAKLVLFHLLNSNGQRMFQVDEIARACGIGTRTAFRCLDQLQKHRYITRKVEHVRTSDGEGWVHRTRIRVL